MRKANILTAAFLLIGLLIGSTVSAQRIDLGRASSAQQCANVTDDGFTATFSFSSINASDVNTEKGVFSSITMDGTYPSGNVGEPSLPAANQLIAVPFGVNDITVEVKNYTTSTYRLADYGITTIYPQQDLIFKNQNPEDVQLAYSEKAYAAKGFAERPIAQVQIQGTMRGIQIGALTINPVQYDAANNSIRVYNDIEVEVRYGQYDKSASYGEFERTFSPYFAGIYKQMFNWRDDVYDQHPDLWQAPVKMLIVANRMFDDVIQDWLAWKTLKGIYIDLNFTDEVGTSAAAIKSFIQGKYAQDAPTFLIIMGDKDQVPASATGSQTSCVTDLYYSSADGDEFPDMFHSRLSATTKAQMSAMLSKALEYEQYTMPDPSYLNKVLLIAGEDNGYGITVGRPTIWYATNYYYNTEHGFTQVNEFSHGTYTNCYSYLSTGVGFANYTAHGSQTSWAGPEFNVNNVNSLTNEHKYFLAIGNCCQSGDWGYGTCFGEAMVRAENKGAYAYIGSCPNTTWYNDYYFGVGATTVNTNISAGQTGTMPTTEQTTMGMYDAIWNDDAYHTVNSFLFVGNLACNAAQALGYQMHSATLYYWQAYHTLGDGTIMPYRVQPTENNVSHMPIFPIGISTFEVSAVPGSYVAISKDGVLHGTALVGSTGTVNVPVEPITSGGDVTICVTAPQRIPYIQTIPAAALEGPFIAVDSYSPANVHVGDEAQLGITFKNVGTGATSGTTNVALTCDDPRLTLSHSTGSFGSLAPEATTTVNGFSYSIASGVADGTTFSINVAAVCGSSTWEGRVNITAGEASLEFVDALAGGFTPGETVTVVANFQNTGHYMATNAVATIASTSQYVSFESSSVQVGTIDPEGIASCVFNVIVSANCPSTEQLPLTFTLNADGGLTASGSATLQNTCVVVFNLQDSYGDGWDNNAHLTVSFSDGTPSQNLAVSSGGSATYTLQIGQGVHVTLTWVGGGYWDSECSFSVTYEDGTPITEANVPSSGWSWSYEFDVNCGGSTDLAPVTNLQAQPSAGNVTLTWTAPAGATNFIVKRNGLEIGETAQATYVDNTIDHDGSYTYCVTAEYPAGLSVPACVTVNLTDDVIENEVRFAIYPNPVNNTLYVEGEGEYSYMMYNGMGQKVAEGTANGNTQISVNDMAHGVYFLRLTSGTQVRVVKVVVE